MLWQSFIISNHNLKRKRNLFTIRKIVYLPRICFFKSSSNELAIFVHLASFNRIHGHFAEIIWKFYSVVYLSSEYFVYWSRHCWTAVCSSQCCVPNILSLVNNIYLFFLDYRLARNVRGFFLILELSIFLQHIICQTVILRNSSWIAAVFWFSHSAKDLPSIRNILDNSGNRPQLFRLKSH